MPKLADIRQVFYVPGKPGIIDAVNPDTGRGLYGGRTLEEIQRENPGAVVADVGVAIAANEALFREPPVEMSEAAWREALDVLPPVGWTSSGDTETFKLAERTSGNVTAIYCRIGARYFCLSDDYRTPHSDIVAACRAAEHGAVRS